MLKNEILRNIQNIDNSEDNAYFTILESLSYYYDKAILVMENDNNNNESIHQVFQESFIMEADNNKSFGQKIHDGLSKMWESILKFFGKSNDKSKKISNDAKNIKTNDIENLQDELKQKQTENNGQPVPLKMLKGFGTLALGGVTAIAVERGVQFIVNRNNNQDNDETIPENNNDKREDEISDAYNSGFEDATQKMAEVITDQNIHDALKYEVHKDGTIKVWSNVEYMLNKYKEMVDEIADAENIFNQNKSSDKPYSSFLKEIQFKIQQIERLKDLGNREDFITFEDYLKYNNELQKYMKSYSDICTRLIFNINKYIEEKQNESSTESKEQDKNQSQENNQLKSENGQLKEELQKLKDQIVQHEQRESKSAQEFIKQKSESEQALQQIIDQLTKKNEQLRDSLDREVKNNQNYLRLSNHQIMSHFRNILHAMQKCEAFADYLTDVVKINENDIEEEAVLKLIEQGGNKYAICWDVTNYMIHHKRQHREPVTDEEQVVIDKINEYLKQKFDTDQDILFYPKGLSPKTTTTKNPVAFVKQYMQDIDKAIGTFRTAVCVYVPAFQEAGKNIPSTKAIVRGK